MGFDWKAEFIGDGERYDYGSMCMPTMPWSSGEKKKINFYSKGKKKTVMEADDAVSATEQIQYMLYVFRLSKPPLDCSL
jgi:hypothetical protein